MARFLSPEWFQALERAQPVDAGDAGDTAVLTLQQVVTGTPDGEVRYLVVVGSGGARVQPGTSSEPDITFTTDYLTAGAVAEGRLSIQAALAAGRIRIGGDTAGLAAHQALLAGFDPIPAEVRADTSWADTSSVGPRGIGRSDG